MDQDRRIPEDGTLAWVTFNPDLYKHNNIMIIEVPENMRSPSEPFFQLATIDRSIPGNDFEGNRILDNLIPGLPKVTLFEEPKPKDDNPSPPPKKYVPKQEIVKPRRASYSNAGGRSRSTLYKKPWSAGSNRPNPDKINPWVPGKEPYIPGNRHIPNIPLSTESGPRNLVKYHDRPVNDNFIPHREIHPLQQEYPPTAPNYSTGFGDGPSNYSGGYGDGPSSNYSEGFGDGPSPNYSVGRHHRTGYNFRSRNSNQPYNREFRKNNVSKGSRPYVQRGAFRNGGRSIAAKQNFKSNEVQQTSTHNKVRGTNYNANKRRKMNRNLQKSFHGRDRQNYR